ncbi:hypothetical protein, conserved [Eimeria necatrix]|uniref:Uncharacterized protein n=1 Tax=Eimeria necatrix TaxID=51315 RepID=U6MHL1_9EIME|nr:hypothetical protein, conserved [Eimeria necatrix]CDJ62528.1 hypothetical protein, conserved [Eimeria necatrix]
MNGGSMDKGWQDNGSEKAIMTDATSSLAAAAAIEPSVKQRLRTQRCGKPLPPMSPTQACVTRFLLRKALGEELQTTVIRWKNPPNGQKHEAEVSIPDPPRWERKIPMHFCPLRRAYVCPVPVVKGRLLVRFLVDGRAYAPHQLTKHEADIGETRGLLLLPGSSLGDRVAPRYPWKAARQWQQQQKVLLLQQLDREQFQDEELQLKEQPQPQERQPEHPQQQEQNEQDSSELGQGVQSFLETGVLEAPLRPPRHFSMGLLGSPDSLSSSWNCSQEEPGAYSWGPPCRPYRDHSRSSNEDEDLSPLQKRPSWACGSRMHQGRQRHIPPRWQQHQEQQRPQHQQHQQQQQLENALKMQEQEQHSHKERRNHGHHSANHQHKHGGMGEYKSLSTSDSDGPEHPYCPDDSAGESAAIETVTTATGATAGSVFTSNGNEEASRGFCSPKPPPPPSTWVLRGSFTDSPRGLSPGRAPKVAIPDIRITTEGPQQKLGMSPDSCESDPQLSSIRASQYAPCKALDWRESTDDEYPWSSWPWGLSRRPLSSTTGAAQRNSSSAKHAQLRESCTNLARAMYAEESDSYTCRSNSSSNTSTQSMHSNGIRQPPGSLRKCRDVLIDSADLTGGLLWAHRRSHSYWDLRRPLSTSPLLLRYTRSLSLQW